MKRNLKIVTSGQAVPKHVVTNQDLTAWLDTSNEWITSRTGIKARHLSDGENTADLATRAAKQALERAKWDPTSLDLIIVATMTPEALMPSTAATVQGRLGATKAAAFDLSAACTGFVDALTVANQMLQSPQFQRILVIGAETMSKILDWQDRTTAVLFGDGAGAVLVEASDEPVGFLGFDLMTDGQQGSRLTAGQTSPYPTTDVVIMAAAVADYRVKKVASQKIKKENASWHLELVKNEDILFGLGQTKRNQLLIGFAAETENLLANAQAKLTKKNLDLLVANDVARKDIGFASDSNEVTLLTKNQEPKHLKRASKQVIAGAILDEIVRLM